jgi:hypothetical protein
MSNDLTGSLERLTHAFVQNVLAAIRGASLEDLADVSSAGGAGSTRGKAPSASRPARSRAPAGRIRRSPEDLERGIAKVVAVVKAAGKSGMRSEAIQKATGLTRRQTPLVLRKAVATKALRRKGAKRSTVYFAE